jgi:hypothetical protein
LCAAALVSKIMTFFQEEGTHVVFCVQQHPCLTFELYFPVREFVDIFVVDDLSLDRQYSAIIGTDYRHWY